MLVFFSLLSNRWNTFEKHATPIGYVCSGCFLSNKITLVPVAEGAGDLLRRTPYRMLKHHPDKRTIQMPQWPSMKFKGKGIGMHGLREILTKASEMSGL